MVSFTARYILYFSANLPQESKPLPKEPDDKKRMKTPKSKFFFSVNKNRELLCWGRCRHCYPPPMKSGGGYCFDVVCLFIPPSKFRFRTLS